MLCMKKSYHEHCWEEHTEALEALQQAKLKTQKNIPVVFVNESNQKVIFTVPPNRLTHLLNRLKKKTGIILEVDGKPFKTVKNEKGKHKR